MIKDLKPYPSHRTTGVYWLPQVPAHWEIVRSKHVFAERTELARAGDRQLSATQAYGVIPQAEFERRVGRRVVRISMHLDKRSHVEEGDFVISMRSFQGGLERAWASGAIRSSYVVLRPARELERGYFTHLFKAQPYIKALQATGNFIRDGQDLTFGNFSRVDLPVPPRDEQLAIGRFLDHANRRIDQFIRAKKKLIALLNEQKQAIIHRAVTRGVETKSTWKVTESRWFPSIPSPWDILPLARVITAAIDGPHFSPAYLDKGVPFLSARNIKTDRWSLDDAKFISEADYEDFSRRVKPEVGDVLYTKGGTTGVARAVDLTFKFQVWVHVAVLKLVRSRVEPSFLAYALNSPRCYEQAQLFTRGATNQDLGLGRMKRIELPLPPTIEEQWSIARHLDSETQRFSTAIRSAEREIVLAREYRTRLISDVVTGQLDVRAAAASLPDLEPDTAPLENPDAETDLDDAEDVT